MAYIRVVGRDGNPRQERKPTVKMMFFWSAYEAHQCGEERRIDEVCGNGRWMVEWT